MVLHVSACFCMFPYNSLIFASVSLHFCGISIQISSLDCRSDFYWSVKLNPWKRNSFGIQQDFVKLIRLGFLIKVLIYFSESTSYISLSCWNCESNLCFKFISFPKVQKQATKGERMTLHKSQRNTKVLLNKTNFVSKQDSEFFAWKRCYS